MNLKKTFLALLISFIAMSQAKAAQTTAIAPENSHVDITIPMLKEAANFSATMNGRYGTPTYWTVDNYSLSNYRGGIDSNGGSTNYLSVQVWDESEDISGLENSRIYQTVELDPGTYYFGARYNTRKGLDKGYLFVTTTLSSTSDIPTSSLVCHPLTDVPAEQDLNTTYGVTFTLTQKQTVYLGWQADLRDGGQQEMRVKAVRLLRYSGIADLTTDKLVESTKFSATGTLATDRFGQLASPWIVTDNIKSNGGTKGGFDYYDNPYGDTSCGFLGFQRWFWWNAAIENGKIYQTTKAQLPAGNYKLRATVHGRTNMANAVSQLRVVAGTDFPDMGVNDQSVLGSYNLNDMNGSNDYDIDFALTASQFVTTGLLVNIPYGSTEDDIRISSILLLKDAGNGNYEDVTDSYLENSKAPIRRGDLARWGKPVNWTTENYMIDCGANGKREGIDAMMGQNTLNLLVWDDGGVEGFTDSRIYRKVHLQPGTYYFGAAYEIIDRMHKAYMFATKELVATADLETSAQTLGLVKLHELPNFEDNNHSRDEMYPLTFTLTEESDVYLGWQADLHESGQQQFRAYVVKLAKVKEYVTLDEDDENLPLACPWADVTIKRTLKVDNWNTLCLPFDMDIPEGWTVKEFSSSTRNGDNITAVFADATTISAGVPYIVKTTEAVTEIVVSDVAVDPTLAPVSDENLTMIGNMKKMYVPEGSYFISSSKFYLADQANYVTSKGFHAWFTPTLTSNAKILNVQFEGEVTGIQTVLDSNDSSSEIFDLQGRRVSSLTKGLYILNGKKVFVK